MNGKASVSKELNEKHIKILEGLLKLPENKECADCRSKAPRWASINLGIFICMRCSGIHRSLGTHISQVRSTTLDTWLPDQVVFMQMMGNKKSNEYWEEKLPQQIPRKTIEQFIRDKYIERKWASKTSPQPMVSVNADKSVAGTSTREIPRKARKYSLDEGFFADDINKTAPPPRNRGSSFDFKSDLIPVPPSRKSAGENKSKQNVDPNADLFSLLYTAQPDRAVVPPSRWATFD